MTEKIVILGASGHAREMLDLLEACQAAGRDSDVLGYIVDAGYGKPGTIINDRPILGGFDWLSDHARDVCVVAGVGEPQLRACMVGRCIELGLRFPNFVHPGATLTRWVTMGDGVLITAGCVLTNRIVIGDHVQLNRCSTIGHDAVLQDLVTVGPGVNVSGNVTVGRGSYIGTGCNIIERVSIGEWSVIGAGTTVIRDVPPHSTVVGNPGRVIKTREPGWHPEEPVADS